MKKVYIFLTTILAILLVLSGCEKDNLKEAKKFGENFLKKVYTFNDVNKITSIESRYIIAQNSIENIKPLMTEEAIKNNRYTIVEMPIKVASANKSNLSVEKLELKQIRNEEDNNFYYFNYNMTIKLTPLESGKESQTVDLSGKLIIFHDNNGFKIDNIISPEPDIWHELSYPESLREK